MGTRRQGRDTDPDRPDDSQDIALGALDRADRAQRDDEGYSSPAPRADRLSNGELYGAAQFDPVLWRYFSRMQNLLARPGDVLGDPDIVQAVRDGGRPPLPATPAPSRAELIELIRHAGPHRRPMERSA